MKIKYTGYYMEEGWEKPRKCFQLKCPIHGYVIIIARNKYTKPKCPLCTEYNNLKNSLEIIDSEIETLSIIEKRTGKLTDEQIDKSNKLRYQHMHTLEKISNINRRY